MPSCLLRYRCVLLLLWYARSDKILGLAAYDGCVGGVGFYEEDGSLVTSGVVDDLYIVGYRRWDRVMGRIKRGTREIGMMHVYEPSVGDGNI